MSMKIPTVREKTKNRKKPHLGTINRVSLQHTNMFYL